MRCLAERDRRYQDSTPELVRVALDESLLRGSRQRALEVLGTVGDRGSAPLLAPLVQSKDPTLRAYAEAAVAALARR